MMIANQSRLLMVPAERSTCPRCKGFGAVLGDEDTCGTCRGHGEVWASACGWTLADGATVGQDEELF